MIFFSILKISLIIVLVFLPSGLLEPLELPGSSEPSIPFGSSESLECFLSIMSFRRKSIELLSRKLTDLMMIEDDSLLYNIRNDDPDSLLVSKEFFLLSKVS